MAEHQSEMEMPLSKLKALIGSVDQSLVGVTGQLPSNVAIRDVITNVGDLFNEAPDVYLVLRKAIETTPLKIDQAFLQNLRALYAQGTECGERSKLKPVKSAGIQAVLAADNNLVLKIIVALEVIFILGIKFLHDRWGFFQSPSYQFVMIMLTRFLPMAIASTLYLKREIHRRLYGGPGNVIRWEIIDWPGLPWIVPVLLSFAI